MIDFKDSIDIYLIHSSLARSLMQHLFVITQLSSLLMILDSFLANDMSHVIMIERHANDFSLLESIEIDLWTVEVLPAVDEPGYA